MLPPTFSQLETYKCMQTGIFSGDANREVVDTDVLETTFCDAFCENAELAEHDEALATVGVKRGSDTATCG